MLSQTSVRQIEEMSLKGDYVTLDSDLVIELVRGYEMLRRDICPHDKRDDNGVCVKCKRRY